MSEVYIDDVININVDTDDININNETSDSSDLETLFTSTAVGNVCVCVCVFALILSRFFVLCCCRGNTDRRDLEQDEQLQQVEIGR